MQRVMESLKNLKKRRNEQSQKLFGIGSSLMM